MRRLLLLPCKSITKNWAQSLAIIISMILSVVMIVSISSMMYSAQQNKTASDRDLYGDFHFKMLANQAFARDVKKGTETGYSLKNVQYQEMRKTETYKTNYTISYVFADEDCLNMISHELVKGYYPKTPHEVAMDYATLRNFGAEGRIGEEVSINNHKLILSGILKDPPIINNEQLDLFVSSDFPADQNIPTVIYLKFDETQDLYAQVGAFVQKWSLKKEWLTSNGELLTSVINGNFQRMVNVIRETLNDQEANFTTLLMQLQAGFHFTSGIVIFLFTLYAMMIIYSIFSISIARRTKSFGVLKAIGISDKTIGGLLFIELLILFLISFPLGVSGGILLNQALFERLSALFSGKASLVASNHSGANQNRSTIKDLLVSQNKIFIDWQGIIFTGCLVLLFLILTCFILMRQVGNKNVMELSKDTSKTESLKIYSHKSSSLLSKLINKFMFKKISSLIIIILSLSTGGVMLLTTNYISKNTKLNNELVLHSADGLSADVKIFETSERLDQGISEEQLTSIRQLPGVKNVNPFKYILGEIPIDKSQLAWNDYWPEIADDPDWVQSPDIMNRFNGIVVESQKEYKIKSNVYGYNDEELEQLKPYVIEGEIEAQDLKSGNKIILRTLVDAQNNTDGLQLHAGDSLTIKTPTALDDPSVLKFNLNKTTYQEITYTIAAVVNSTLAQNQQYIADEGLDVIMRDSSFDQNYGIKTFNLALINKNRQKDIKVLNQIGDILAPTPNVQITDNSVLIAAKNQELARAAVFISGIAILLIIVSIFNINNTIFHLLYSRRYAFAVLRAMGIDKSSFYQMLLKESGRYALITCLTILGIYYGAIQPVVSRALIHVYGYMNNLESVDIGLVLLLCAVIIFIFVVTILVPANQLLNKHLSQELKR